MQLNLSKPLVFFDLETTGVNVGKDHIVEISLHKVMPDGTEMTMTERVRPTDANGNTLHIPEESTEIHGISDADVASRPSFKELAPNILAFIGDADLAGYNSNKFDVPLLVEEMLRAGYDFDVRQRNLIDVQNIFHKMEKRTLKAAYQFYCHKDLDNAHSADADTIATYHVLMAQLDLYKDADYEEDGKTTRPVVNDVKALSKFSTMFHTADLVGHLVYNEKNHIVFNFGKYKGQRVDEVFMREPSYHGWMKQADFPLSTKRVIDEIMNQVKLQQLQNKFNH